VGLGWDWVGLVRLCLDAASGESETFWRYENEGDQTKKLSRGMRFCDARGQRVLSRCGLECQRKSKFVAFRVCDVNKAAALILGASI